MNPRHQLNHRFFDNILTLLTQAVIPLAVSHEGGDKLRLIGKDQVVLNLVEVHLLVSKYRLDVAVQLAQLHAAEQLTVFHGGRVGAVGAVGFAQQAVIHGADRQAVKILRGADRLVGTPDLPAFRHDGERLQAAITVGGNQILVLAEGRVVEDLGVGLLVIGQHKVQAEQLRLGDGTAQKAGAEGKLHCTGLHLIVDVGQAAQLAVGVEFDLNRAVGLFLDQLGELGAVFVLHTAINLFQGKTPCFGFYFGSRGRLLRCRGGIRCRRFFLGPARCQHDRCCTNTSIAPIHGTLLINCSGFLTNLNTAQPHVHAVQKAFIWVKVKKGAETTDQIAF